MDLKPGTPMTSIAPNNVFIGSCTNGRIEDIRAAAYVVRKLGKKVAPTVKQALVVPGSGLVREQAEDEGLDKIFIEAGFQWRRPGCSMCLAMNADRLEPGDRCASTSNRNFEGAKAIRAARIFALRPWPLRQPSKVILLMCANFSKRGRNGKIHSSSRHCRSLRPL